MSGLGWQQLVSQMEVLASLEEPKEAADRCLEIALALSAASWGRLELAREHEPDLTCELEARADGAGEAEAERTSRQLQRVAFEDERGSATVLLARDEKLSETQGHQLDVLLKRALSVVSAAERYHDLDRLVADEMARAVESEEAMTLVLDSMTDGLLVADRSGRLSPIVSRTARQWFGEPADEQLVWDYLAPGDGTLSASLQLAIDEMVDDTLPFELIADQAPRRMLCGDRILGLSYDRVPRTGALSQVVLRLKDITERCAAEAADRVTRQLMRAVQELLKDQSGFLAFLKEVERLLETLEQDATARELQLRALHTLKGNTAVYGFEEFAGHCHRLETTLVDSSRALAPDEIAELRQRWKAVTDPLSPFTARGIQGVALTPEEHSEALAMLHSGADHTTLLKMVESWKREPLLPRMRLLASEAERLAISSDRLVEVDLCCEVSRLPRSELSRLVAAFVHVVRNAVAHGIESAEHRARAEKPRAGRIALSARMRSDAEFELVCTDDGRGVDFDRVREQAHQAGLPSETQGDLIGAMMADKLSTAGEATALAGRGVGLSAMREVAQALGGELSLTTAVGSGTTVVCRVPVHPCGPLRSGSPAPA